jgi:hypothetical protein
MESKMDFRRYPTPLREAIRELAETNARLHISTAITAADAAPHVDEDTLTAFWALMRAEQSDPDAWSDIYDTLDVQQSAVLHAALACGHPSSATILRDATVKHVAKWLANEASDYQLDMEPTEAELTRVEPFDDPVRADRRDIAREHNAALRAAGMWS